MQNDEKRTAYLDWVNNYLTIDAFAEHRGISENDALALITEGKQLHEKYVQSLVDVDPYYNNA